MMIDMEQSMENGKSRSYFCYRCKASSKHHLKYGWTDSSSPSGDETAQALSNGPKNYWECDVCGKCLNSVGGDECCLRLLYKRKTRIVKSKINYDVSRFKGFLSIKEVDNDR